MVVTQVPAQRAAPGEGGRDWWREAACREADPELFFPVAAYGPGIIEIARAKAVCERCPVRGSCLRYALETRQAHGVWGGLTEGERQLHELRERERVRQRRERRQARGEPGRTAGSVRPELRRALCSDLPEDFSGGGVEDAAAGEGMNRLRPRKRAGTVQRRRTARGEPAVARGRGAARGDRFPAGSPVRRRGGGRHR
jgi:WhiB family transcriptional regulator, redox-sensing transcriptional regulator